MNQQKQLIKSLIKEAARGAVRMMSYTDDGLLNYSLKNKGYKIRIDISKNEGDH